MKFSELVRLLEENGFRIVKEKGSMWIITVQRKFPRAHAMLF